jgi:hypothetical protein
VVGDERVELARLVGLARQAARHLRGLVAELGRELRAPHEPLAEELGDVVPGPALDELDVRKELVLRRHPGLFVHAVGLADVPVVDERSAALLDDRRLLEVSLDGLEREALVHDDHELRAVEGLDEVRVLEIELARVELEGRPPRLDEAVAILDHRAGLELRHEDLGRGVGDDRLVDLPVRRDRPQLEHLAGEADRVVAGDAGIVEDLERLVHVVDLRPVAIHAGHRLVEQADRVGLRVLLRAGCGREHGQDLDPELLRERSGVIPRRLARDPRQQPAHRIPTRLRREDPLEMADGILLAPDLDQRLRRELEIVRIAAAHLGDASERLRGAVGIVPGPVHPRRGDGAATPRPDSAPRDPSRSPRRPRSRP